MLSEALSIDDILDRNSALARAADEAIAPDIASLADGLLADGERILEIWLETHGAVPGAGEVEGFRLLGLHRQSAKGNPSFNACRETCREIVFHRNVVAAAPQAPDACDMIRRGAMVVVHLALFVGGKLEVAGLGDFCCSSRPIRQAELFSQDTKRTNAGGLNASR